MFKVTKRALTAMAFIAMASAPTTAHAISVVLPNADQQTMTVRSLPAPSASTGNATVRPNADEQRVTGGTTSGVQLSAAIHNGYAAPVSDANGGFDWGDAGIGAAAAIGIVMLGVAVVFARSRRRAGARGGSTAQIT